MVVYKVRQGDVFGNFTVLQERKVQRGSSVKRFERQLLCQCVCGSKKWYRLSRIVTGETKSCGCLTNVTHGGHGTRLYNTWGHMRARCYNPHDKRYASYGGRGITVCDEWKNSFEAFRDWALSTGYNDSLTIDRIDVNGNYCPENCRWANELQQSNNRRSNRMIEYKGQVYTAAELARKVGISYMVMMARLQKGYSIEEAVSLEDKRNLRLVEYNGKTYTAAELAREVGVKYETLVKRLKTGKSVEDAIKRVDMRKPAR